MRSWINENELILVGGKSKNGKSHFTNDLIYKFPRTIILDPKRQYDGKLLNSMASIKKYTEGNPVFRVMTGNVLLFTDLCRHAFDESKRSGLGITLCVEETQRVIPDKNKKICDGLYDIVYRGGSVRVNLVMVAQRLTSIPITVRSQYTKLVTFNQTEPEDLKYFKSISQDPIMLEIPRLPVREYIEITTQQIQRGKS
jgi:hypothetical protein